MRDKVKNLEKLRNEKLKEKIVGGGDISNDKKRNSKSRAVPSQDTEQENKCEQRRKETNEKSNDTGTSVDQLPKLGTDLGEIGCGKQIGDKIKMQDLKHRTGFDHIMGSGEKN